MITWPHVGLNGQLTACEEGLIAALNRNFFITDMIMQLKVVDIVDVLPEDPEVGDVYILSEDSLPYSSAENTLMMWNGAYWTSVIPKIGFISYIEEEDAFYWFDGTSWVPLPYGSGDVNGPASSTDNAVARFDGTTGKIIQNSAVTISDAGVLTATAGIVSDVGTLTTAKITNYQGVTVNNSSAGPVLAAPTSFLNRLTGSVTSVTNITSPAETTLASIWVIENASGHDITFENSASVQTGTGSNLKVKNLASIILVYSPLLGKYIIVGGSGGSGSGGLIVADIAARDAIVTADRYDGLEVYVIANQENYQLQGGILNTNWVKKYDGWFNKIVTKTANAVITYLEDCVFVDATTGPVTLTAPAWALKRQQTYIKLDSTENAVTINFPGTDKLLTEEGLVSTWTLPYQNNKLRSFGAIAGTTTPTVTPNIWGSL